MIPRNIIGERSRQTSKTTTCLNLGGRKQVRGERAGEVHSPGNGGIKKKEHEGQKVRCGTFYSPTPKTANREI